MDIEQWRADIARGVQQLNAQLQRQNSFKQRFLDGVVYGVGFVIGSVLVASVLIGLLSPWLKQLPFVQGLYQSGQQVINH